MPLRGHPVLSQAAILIARYYSELLGFFARALQDRDAAADVVQESYARVLTMNAQAAALDPRALLYRIGKNLVIDDARRRAAEARVLEALALAGADEAPSTERVVGARQQAARLLARLSAMPRKRREAFVLVRIYGYSHAQAAAHLDTTEASIEKHVVRAVCDCAGLAPAGD